MSDKAVLGSLIAELEDVGLRDMPAGAADRTLRKLREIEFAVRSPCGDVKAWMSADGGLRELVIKEGALRRHDHRQMAALIHRTVTTAENMIIEAVAEIARRRTS